MFCYIQKYSEYSIGDYKPSKISFKEVMKNLEMLKIIPAHLTTKEMCNYVVQKLPFVIRYVPVDIRLKKCVTKLF